MNWGHLRAIFWLRSRVLANRLRRTGTGSKLLSLLVAILVLLASLGCFFAALTLGLTHLPNAKPLHLMLVWVGIASAFLFFWMVGLVTDLQRSDSMSIKNFQHLPISLGWIFAYNYASSFVSWSVALFVPGMLALSSAMVVVYGARMLLAFVLVLAFLGLTTALTYQLRGWLARLMEDKRRGRNIVAVITLAFVLLAQAPNLLQLGDRSSRRERRQASRELSEALEEKQAGIAGAEERKAAAIQRLDELRAEEDAVEERIAAWVTRASQIVPFGWLPYGVRQLAERRILPALLCAAGMLFLTTLSLRRAYRATLAMATGTERASRKGPSAPARPARPRIPAGRTLIDRRLPLVAEEVSAICMANLRSLLRSPELKLILLGQIVLLGLFGFMLSSGGSLASLKAGPHWLGLGASALMLLGMMQVVQNQFGLDRTGFRTYVLCPVPRAQILRGKNLSISPFGLGLGFVALTGLQVLRPCDVEHFAGLLVQSISAFLLLCLIGNLISILGPMRLQTHGLRAADAKLKHVLWQFASVILCPVVLSPLLLPALLEFVLRQQAFASWLPIFLLGHIVLLVASLLTYRIGTIYQGELLQEREQRMLEILTRQAS